MNDIIDDEFAEVLQLIKNSKEKIYRQINSELINLYWRVGEYVSEKTQSNKWGKQTVEQLSNFILSKYPGYKGFSARNIWRMKQFYEIYSSSPKLSPMVTEISWSNHLQILSKTKTQEEKYYYIQLCAKHKYSKRDLAKLIENSSYERVMLSHEKLSPLVSENTESLTSVFKDTYVFDFLDLPDTYKEQDLRKALVSNLKDFLFEMGPDFSLIGEEYVVQVGKKDFRIDLLMFHRGLNSLVAIELKTTEFKPGDLGQLQFYLEALDQDVRKEHENPSVGILICKTKDDEVVKYALNRNASPAKVAEYETKLIGKELLQKKLHEISERISVGNVE